MYRSAVDAVAPAAALTRALERERRDRSSWSRRVWIFALGKAALPMAEAAVRALAADGAAPAGGLVVAPSAEPPPHPSVRVVAGDHPEPGAGSLSAADALLHIVAAVAPGDTVWVLLSGGTTSLVGAPQPGIAPGDLKTLYGQLLRSGLDIKAMNRVRKRFTRWSAGRLARDLAHAARVQCFIVSDVIGDDLAAIGSGPCTPDSSTADDVRETLTGAGLWDDLPSSIRQHLDDVRRGRIPETPKPDDPAFAHVENHLVATNRGALEAAAARARALGLVPEIAGEPLSGEAAAAGARIAHRLSTPASVAGGRSAVASDTSDPSSRPHVPGVADPDAPRRCLIFGGETTVTIRGEAGLGGRSQELALSAARVLRGSPRAALLAAGTDGRDGPTDAAGAIVDGGTWDEIAAAGRDPESDLRRHDSYAALASAGALIKTGPTGTNVMDIVIGVC
jgi:hydroxypyruvate reductase